MKGEIERDFMIKLVLSLLAMAIILAVLLPLIQQAGSNAQGCGAFRNWITDLSSGGVELC